ncbi:cupin domain-containing protein [Cognatishimia sp. SS12]|uniref:cupin domain-containing protein n=1 Tax=Cognatishimia sp. SS12 TaxID=2979465 RepID=UPI00232E72A8|nr:cupin domain-containing protein [Cognatishimia sp. SS12]MDC0736724.1 cupin domain-containing protein [Cognatishimia sp. SS12]
MPKVDLTSIAPRTGTVYPAAFHAEMAGRSSLRFSDAAGLTQFGANITILQPGAKSSLRHWHETQDELVLVISGTATLLDDTGETLLHAGECAAFPAGDGNGHCLRNDTDQELRFLAVGARTETEIAHYSDLDMTAHIRDRDIRFTHKDGTPYGERRDE